MSAISSFPTVPDAILAQIIMFVPRAFKDDKNFTVADMQQLIRCNLISKQFYRVVSQILTQCADFLNQWAAAQISKYKSNQITVYDSIPLEDNQVVYKLFVTYYLRTTTDSRPKELVFSKKFASRRAAHYNA